MRRDVVMMGRREAQAKRDDDGTATRNDDGTDDGNNAGSATSGGDDRGGRPQPPPPPSHRSWKRRLAVRLVPVDAALSIARYAGRVSRWSTFAAARCVASAPALLVPENWRDWAAAAAEADKNDGGGGWGALLPGSERYGWTREAVSALFDVHGYQILNQGLFSEYYETLLCLRFLLYIYFE